MNARLERRLRLFAIIVVAGIIASMVFTIAQGYTSLTGIAVGISYGILLTVPIAGISLFVLSGPMRAWLGGLSFIANLMVRSAIFAAIILPIQYFQLGSVIVGVRVDPTHRGFWIAIVFSVVCVILANLVIGIANLIGPRSFLNFIVGRYHSPIEENRFVLFVDIA